MTRWFRSGSFVLLWLSLAGGASAQAELDVQAGGTLEATAGASATSETPAAPPWRDGLLASRRGFARRPLNLKGGVVRLDFGPSDFAYMDSGELNSGRGLRVDAGLGASDSFSSGTGIAVGLCDRFELGALLLPLRMVPDPEYGDLEVYGRLGFTDWIALQLALQLPTMTDFGVGLGFPLRFPIGDTLRLDTGVEAEFVLASDARANLDVPVALNLDVTERFFAGLRTGVFLSDFADLAVSAGFQFGVTLDDVADITASFSWPRLVWTGAGDSVNGDVINVTLGLTVYIDARDEDAMEDEARLKARAARASAPAAAEPADATEG